MENRSVGYFLLLFSLVITGIIFLFNKTLKEIVYNSCTNFGHPEVCPMLDSVSKQTYLSLMIVSVVYVVAFILIFAKPENKIIIKKINKAKKVFDTSGLKSEEKRIFEIIKKEKSIFQADLIEKTGSGKARMTRIIDRLEGQGFVERKRRGMTNIVVLKD